MAAQEPAARPKRSAAYLGIFGIVLLAGLTGGFGVSRLTAKSSGNSAKPAKQSHRVKAAYELGEFTVNLADYDPPRYLRAKIVLGLREPLPGGGQGEKSPLGHYELMMRDAALEVLTSKHFSELLTLDGKRKLKTELKRRFETITEADPQIKVEEIYLTDFVMQ